jgi:hypothetical protein
MALGIASAAIASPAASAAPRQAHLSIGAGLAGHAHATPLRKTISHKRGLSRSSEPAPALLDPGNSSEFGLYLTARLGPRLTTSLPQHTLLLQLPSRAPPRSSSTAS